MLGKGLDTVDFRLLIVDRAHRGCVDGSPESAKTRHHTETRIAMINVRD
jgi:hypothetical protein